MVFQNLHCSWSMKTFRTWMQYHLRVRCFSSSLQWQQHRPVSLVGVPCASWWSIHEVSRAVLGKLILGLLLHERFTTFISSSTSHHSAAVSCLASSKTVHLILEQTSWLQNGTTRTCSCSDRDSCRHKPNFVINFYAFCHMKYLTEERPWSYSFLLLIQRISSITDLWGM